MHLYVTLKQMKKTLLAFFIVSFWVQTNLALEIKAMLGLNSSQYIPTSEIATLDLKSKTGLTFGLGAMVALNNKMELELNALFRQGGAKASATYGPDQLVPATYRNNALAFPIFFKYRLLRDESAYIALGPEFTFLLSHHLFFSDEEKDFNLKESSKTFVLAYTAMIGYELPVGDWSLCAEIRYSRWLSSFLRDPETGMKSKSFAFVLGGIYYL